MRTASDVALVVLTAAVVFLPALGQEHSWSSRELRHALISLEMAATGEQLVPRLLGRPYADKPPTFHVAAAAASRLVGSDSMLFARLPSVLAGLVGALSVYGMGRLVHGRLVARLAAVGLLAVFGYVRMARIARPDMLFGAAIALAAFGLLLAMASRGSRDRALGFALAGASAGLAVLTKGPYGLLFPAMVVVFAAGPATRFTRPRLAEWAIFAAALAIAPGGWALALALGGQGDHLSQVLLQPDLVSGASRHARSVTWYLGPVLLSSLPLSLFLWLWLRPPRPPASPFAWIALVLLVVLSLVPGKRAHYLVPWYPFAALAVCAAVGAAGDRARQLAAAAIAASVLAVPFYYGFVLPLYQPHEPLRTLADQVLARSPQASRFVCEGSLAEAVAFQGLRSGRLRPGDVAREWVHTRAALPPGAAQAVCLVFPPSLFRDWKGALERADVRTRTLFDAHFEGDPVRVVIVEDAA